MPKGKYFGATDIDLEKLKDELIAWREKELSDRRVYFVQHGRYPKPVRRKYLKPLTTVKVLAEAHSVYFKNHRLVYRQAYHDPAAVEREIGEPAPAGSMEALGQHARRLELTFGPQVCNGIILGVKRRQEGRRFPGHRGGFDSESEPATFELYRNRLLYVVAVDVFSPPIQVLVDDVVALNENTGPIENAIRRLEFLMDNNSAL